MAAPICACLMALILAADLDAAWAPVPKEALKALKISKGKPCRTGVVFMDGKYLPPPYVVKRYGTALMINDVQVTPPIIPWEEFLKTQAGAQVTPPAVTSSPTVVEAPQPVEEKVAQKKEEEQDPLADLFDDEPQAEKKVAASAKPASETPPPQPPKPAAQVSCAWSGEFIPNQDSKALVDKINRSRQDINTRLAKGGFIFFGSNYARVSGEARETRRLLAKLPDLLRRCNSSAELYAAFRRNEFPYLTERIAKDLYRCKYLYPQIEARAKQLKEDL